MPSPASRMPPPGCAAAAAGDRPAPGVGGGGHRRGAGRGGRGAGPGPARQPDPAGAPGHVAAGVPARGGQAARELDGPPLEGRPRIGVARGARRAGSVPVSTQRHPGPDRGGRARPRPRRWRCTSGGCRRSTWPGHVSHRRGRLRRSAPAASTWCCSTSTCRTCPGLEVLRRLRAAGLDRRRHRHHPGPRPVGGAGRGVVRRRRSTWSSRSPRPRSARSSSATPPTARRWPSRTCPSPSGRWTGCFGALRETGREPGLPKGISRESLQTVVSACAPPWNATRGARIPRPRRGRRPVRGGDRP